MRLVVPIMILAFASGCKKDPVASSNGNEKPERGKVVRLAEHRLEVWFPEDPTVQDTKAGQKQFKVVDSDKKGVYLATAKKLDHKVDLTNTASIDTFMIGAKVGLLSGPNKGGKITSEEKYKLADKFPSLKVDVELPNKNIYRVRLIQGDTHFYTLTVAGPKEFVESVDATKFLDSFKIAD